MHNSNLCCNQSWKIILTLYTFCHPKYLAAKEWNSSRHVIDARFRKEHGSTWLNFGILFTYLAFHQPFVNRHFRFSSSNKRGPAHARSATLVILKMVGNRVLVPLCCAILSGEDDRCSTNETSCFVNNRFDCTMQHVEISDWPRHLHCWPSKIPLVLFWGEYWAFCVGEWLVLILYSSKSILDKFQEIDCFALVSSKPITIVITLLHYIIGRVTYWRYLNTFH